MSFEGGARVFPTIMGGWSAVVYAELAFYHAMLLIYGASILVFISPIESAWKKPMATWVANSRLVRQLQPLSACLAALYALATARGLVGLALCGSGGSGSGAGAAGGVGQQAGLLSWLSGGGDPLLCALRCYLGAGLWVGESLAAHFSFLLTGCADDALAAEEAAARRAMLAWAPPPRKLFDALLAPYSFLLRPEVTGLAEMQRALAGRPALFVMNHSLGGLEMPITTKVLYGAGIYVRGLADHLHWSIPGTLTVRSLLATY